MNSMKCLALLGAALLSTGCGINQGFLRDSSTATQLQYRMDISAIRYHRSVSGSADIGSIFCAIPIGDNAYEGAMQRLYAAASLKPNEIVVNFREDHAFTMYLGFYCKQHLTVSGDVVEVLSRNEGHFAPPVAPPVQGLPPAPPAPK